MQFVSDMYIAYRSNSQLVLLCIYTKYYIQMNVNVYSIILILHLSVSECVSE